MKKKVIVIGSGFAGLSAACHLAKAGCQVTLLEKNETLGGRARQFTTDEGLVYDMGPSWYWMPDVFDQFFESFNKKTSDYYNLIRLDPSYQVIFQENKILKVPAGRVALKEEFEKIESGSGKNLDVFLKSAQYKYQVGMNEFVHKPSNSIFEFADLRVLKSLFKLKMFSSISKEINQLFKSPIIKQILEFPVLFLGAKPENTPALYSLMNYADIDLGTWYPEGGMFKIIEGFVSLAKELGVNIITEQEVRSLKISGNRVEAIQTSNGTYYADGIIAACDYHHFDQKILAPEYRQYTQAYWDKRVLAPSSILYYVGVKKKLKNLLHHNLFFDASFPEHAAEIYDEPAWPKNPLFYVCAPSITDPTVAPEGYENLFFLIPLAPGLTETEEIKDHYFDLITKRLEKVVGEDITPYISYKRCFSGSNFITDYNAFKGNAYGLANTLLQTAFLKPKMKHKKIKNLFFAGQLTVPGPGVPPSIISGKVAAEELLKNLN